MSRFQHLEFDDDRNQNAEAAQTGSKSDPGLAQAYDCFDEGLFEKSVRAFNRVLEHQPNLGDAWTGLVLSYLEVNQSAMANRWADSGLDRLPGHAGLSAAKAMALGRCGDFASAMAFSDASMESQPDNPGVWVARGDVMLARKDPAAEYCMEKAKSLAQNDWRTLWRTARSYANFHKFALSLRTAKQALELDPAKCMSWFQLAHAQWALGLAKPALQSLRQARELAPGHEAIENLWRELNNAGWNHRILGWLRRSWQ